MAGSDKQEKAKRVRWADRERAARRDSPTLASLPALSIDDVMPGDAEGLLPAEQNHLPVVVRVEAWANLVPVPGYADVVRVEMARVSSTTWETFMEQEFPFPQNRPDFPKPITLGVLDKDLEGKFQLRWRLKLWNSPGFNEESVSTPLRIDRTPPYGLENPAEVILATNEINDAYLAANGNRVIIEIPGHLDSEPSDMITYGWQKVEPINPEDIVPITPFPVAIPPDRRFEIPLAWIQSMGDGPVFCAYRLYDKAGNPSRLSKMRLRNVALGPLPITPLGPPRVPLAEDDGLIDQLDAATREVAVVIPVVPNGKSSDRIHLTWGTHELEPHPVVPLAETRIKIPLAVPQAQYTQATGEQPTPVKYEVRRGARPFDAPGITVQVDFSRIGPIHPDWPDIINPNLPEVTVWSESGLQDELVKADAGFDAEARFNLPDGLLAGDEIHLMWDDLPVLPVHVVTTEVAGTPMALPILWADIDARGNSPAPGLPVYYWLRRPGQINAEHSKPKLVTVDVHTIVPDEVQFPTSPDGFMFCHRLDWDPVLGLGVRVHIPPNPRYLKEGVVVTIKWQGHRGFDPSGPLPADPIAGTDLDYTFPPLTAGQVSSGLTWVVRPYDTKILPLYGGDSDQIGRGIVSYTVSGVTSPAPEVTLNVALGTGTGTCAIPPAP